MKLFVKSRLSCLVIGMVVSCVFVGLARAEGNFSWPQWGGPNRDAVSLETGLLKAWPAGGPALVWKSVGLGKGYSGLAVVKGRIYTLGDFGTEKALECKLIALDAASGKPLWMTPTGKGGAREV